MKRYLLTAVGRDRPGLVAAVSGVLYDQGCNLEDSAMTRLQGEFAILLILSGPAQTAALEKSLKALGRKRGLAIQLKTVAGRPPRRSAGERVLISVYGADRPGIVHRVTQQIARARVNISDLSTHRTNAPGRPGYILYIEGESPLAAEALEGLLKKDTAEWGVTLGVKALAAPAL